MGGSRRTRGSGWAITVASLLLAPPGWAADDRERAQLLLKDGSKAFEEGQYPKARDRFLAAYQIFKSPRILFNLGRTEERLGDEPAAAHYFRQFLKDTAQKEGISEFQGEANGELKRLEAKVGRLQLRVDSPAARCLVDGQAAGDGILDVAPGSHVVTASVGEKSSQVEVQVGAGEVREVVFAEADMLRSGQGRLDIRTDPAGALIRVDGEEAGPSPTRAEVSPGDHRVEAHLTGYTPASSPVAASAGATTLVQLSLVPRAAEAIGATAATTRPTRIWTWIAAGAAGAAAAGGIGFGVGAQQASRSLLAGSPSQTVADSRYQTTKTRETVANVFYGVAGVAGVGAVTLFFVEGSF